MHFERTIILEMRKSPRDILITILHLLGNHHRRSRQRRFLLMLGPSILLMQLKDILILLKNLALPKGAILLQRKEVLKYIIAIILHETYMGLVEVLTVIFEDYIEDTIVVDAFVL